MAMRAFVEAARQGSLSKAAAALGVSRSLVSRHIQGLEQHLGARLMHRTARSMVLTDVGEKYFHFSETMLSQLEQMEQEISSEVKAAEGTLAILSPKWLGHYAAADAAAGFARTYPSIAPKLSLGGMLPTAYDFLERGFDVALHTRPIPDSRILARRVTSIPFVLCATPDWAEAHGPFRHPRDLEGAPGLLQFNHPAWTFEQSGKTENVMLRPAFSANTYLSLHRGVLAGLGPATLPRTIVAPDIEAGRLVMLLPGWTVKSQSLYVAMAPGGRTPKKVRLFVDFLSDWFKENPL